MFFSFVAFIFQIASMTTTERHSALAHFFQNSSFMCYLLCVIKMCTLGITVLYISLMITVNQLPFQRLDVHQPEIVDSLTNSLEQQILSLFT